MIYEGSFRGPAWITLRKLAKITDGVDQMPEECTITILASRRM